MNCEIDCNVLLPIRKLITFLSFLKEDGSKYIHFESVTVSQDGLEVYISSHIIRENQLRNKLKSDRLLYKATALDEPANSSAEQPTNEGSGLSSEGKGNEDSGNKQENGEENNKNSQGEPSGEPSETISGEEKARKEAEEAARKAAEEAARKEEERRKPLRQRVEEWSDKTGVKVNILERIDDVADEKIKAAIAAAEKQGRRVPGWFDTPTGSVFIYMPHATTERDIDETYLHEVVAHKGLRELLGNEKFDALCDAVWEGMSEEDRNRFSDYVTQAGITGDEAIRRAAADEYMANIAEKLKNGEEIDESLWQKIIDIIMEWLGESPAIKTTMTREDIDKLLRKSLQNMERKAAAKVIATKKGLTIGKPEKGNAGKAAIPAYDAWKETQKSSDVRFRITDAEDAEYLDAGGKNGGSEHTVWIPFSSEQVKSADPITRDDNGNVIPLSQRFDSGNMDIRFRFAEGKEDFENLQRKAVEEKGLVMPNLSESDIKITEVPGHPFRGSAVEALKEAENWAKENITGLYLATDNEGKDFEYNISAKAIDKYVHNSSVKLSDNLGVHLSVLQKLPEVITNSIEAEVHPDYRKEDGKRSASTGFNPSSLIHRFYGAVRIAGITYRVKTTIKEYIYPVFPAEAHNYEVTKIELLEAPSDDSQNANEGPVAMTSTNSISGAKLLQGVEKSYDSGKKLLDESEKITFDNTSAVEGNDTRFRLVDDKKHKEEVQKEVDSLTKQYTSLPVSVISRKAMTEDEILEAFAGDEAKNLTPDERKEAIELLFKRKARGLYTHEFDKVIIFADNISKKEVKGTLFHENIHGLLKQIYGAKTLYKIVEDFWKMAPSANAYTSKGRIMSLYSNPLSWPEEFFTKCLERAMVSGDVQPIRDWLSSDPANAPIIDQILNTIGYVEREKPAAQRGAAEGEAAHGVLQEDNESDRDSNLRLGGIPIDRRKAVAAAMYDKRILSAAYQMQEAKDEDPAVTVGSGLHEGKEKEIAKQTGVARDTYELNMGRAVTRIKEISQDKLQSVLDGIRAIESELGVKVRDHDNPYMAANRGEAKASAQRELYRKKEEKDLLDTLFIVCLLHQTTT